MNRAAKVFNRMPYSAAMNTADQGPDNQPLLHSVGSLHATDSLTTQEAPSACAASNAQMPGCKSTAQLIHLAMPAKPARVLEYALHMRLKAAYTAAYGNASKKALLTRQQKA